MTDYGVWTLLRDLGVAAIGTGIGAFTAFRLQAAREEVQRRNTSHTAGNYALYVLGSQMSIINDILQQSLRRYEGDPMRAFVMPPLALYEASLFLDYPSLMFLIDGKSPDILNLLITSERVFRTALGAIEDRRRVFMDFRDSLNGAGLSVSEPFDRVASAAGEHRIQSVKGATDAVYTSVRAAEAALTDALSAVEKELVRQFPKGRHLGVHRIGYATPAV